MEALGNVIYAARTRTSGEHSNGIARSDDGRLEVRLSAPGGTGVGTNPEQLFAAGWSACFQGAMRLAARRLKMVIPPDQAEIDLCMANGAYHLQARLNVDMPGVDRDMARMLVDTAHKACPYSKAVRGNIRTEINLVLLTKG